MFELLQRQDLAVDPLYCSAWCRDDNVRLGGETGSSDGGVFIAGDVLAADVLRTEGGDRLQRRCDLCCEFLGRDEDESGSVLRRLRADFAAKYGVEDGQKVGKCLAGARLCARWGMSVYNPPGHHVGTHQGHLFLPIPAVSPGPGQSGA